LVLVVEGRNDHGKVVVVREGVRWRGEKSAVPWQCTRHSRQAEGTFGRAPTTVTITVTNAVTLTVTNTFANRR
jgi:hypothetical protein